jgi:superkiller protein 3
MFGFVIVVIDLVRRFITTRLQSWCVVVLIVVFALLTVQRNALWAEPIAFYEDNLRKAPHNVRVYTELSYRYIAAKRYPEAESLLLKADGLVPMSAEVHTYLGILYDQAGYADKSISAFKRAISFDPGYLKAYLELAVVYSNRGENALAEGLLRKAVSSPRAGAAEYYNLGVSLYKQGKKNEAAEFFSTAVKRAPYDIDALNNYGLVKAELGDFAVAQQMAERVSAINPDKGRELLEEIAALKRHPGE